MTDDKAEPLVKPMPFGPVPWFPCGECGADATVVGEQFACEKHASRLTKATPLQEWWEYISGTPPDDGLPGAVPPPKKKKEAKAEPTPEEKSKVAAYREVREAAAELAADLAEEGEE